jgi:hypothetical protein
MPFAPVLGVVLLAALLGSGSEASAASLVYASQTGRVGASGRAPGVPGSGQSFPISGLSDVDQTAMAQNGTPPNFYLAAAELHTRLGATQLGIDGSTLARSCDPFDEPACDAHSDSEVTILFDLAAASVLSIEFPRSQGYNGPLGLAAPSRPRHRDLGTGGSSRQGPIRQSGRVFQLVRRRLRPPFRVRLRPASRSVLWRSAAARRFL